MNSKKHISIILSNNVGKREFITLLLSGKCSGKFEFLNEMNGILYSDITIEDIIEKEYRYDKCMITDRPLRTFSSGERRRVFLKYCLQKSPDFIILDNPTDHLDAQATEVLRKQIEEISHSNLLIQLTNQADDVLQFIKNIYEINDSSFETILYKKERKKKALSLSTLIPEALSSFDIVSNELIKMKDVCVNYGENVILNNINWTVKTNEFWQLTGPNGSGKSTILSLIYGDNPKGYGQDLYLFGRKKGSGENLLDIKKNIGFFNPSMTELFHRGHNVMHMVLSGFFDSIGLYKKPTILQQKIAESWLKTVGMEQMQKMNFNKLSQGQQRVVLIVRAIIKHPPLIILDEPLVGLDEENNRMVTHLINTIYSQTHSAIIYVSHKKDINIKPTAVYQLKPDQDGSLGEIVI